jgi:hypothetical protein
VLTAAVTVRSVQDVMGPDVCSFMCNCNVRTASVSGSPVYTCTKIENGHKLTESCKVEI